MAGKATCSIYGISPQPNFWKIWKSYSCSRHGSRAKIKLFIPLNYNSLSQLIINLFTKLSLPSGAFIIYEHHTLIAGNRKAAIDGDYCNNFKWYIINIIGWYNIHYVLHKIVQAIAISNYIHLQCTIVHLNYLINAQESCTLLWYLQTLCVNSVYKEYVVAEQCLLPFIPSKFDISIQIWICKAIDKASKACRYHVLH